MKNRRHCHHHLKILSLIQAVILVLSCVKLSSSFVIPKTTTTIQQLSSFENNFNHHRHYGYFYKSSAAATSTTDRKERMTSLLHMISTSTNEDEKTTTMDDTNANNNSYQKVEKLVHTFVSYVGTSIQEQTMTSLTFYGIQSKKKKKKKLANAKTQQDEPVRGTIRQIQGRLIQLPSSSSSSSSSSNRSKGGEQRRKQSNINVEADTNDSSTIEMALQLTVKYHGATDICKNIPIVSKMKKHDDDDDDDSDDSDTGITSVRDVLSNLLLLGHTKQHSVSSQRQQQQRQHSSSSEWFASEWWDLIGLSEKNNDNDDDNDNNNGNSVSNTKYIFQRVQMSTLNGNIIELQNLNKPKSIRIIQQQQQRNSSDNGKNGIDADDDDGSSDVPTKIVLESHDRIKNHPLPIIKTTVEDGKDGTTNGNDGNDDDLSFMIALGLLTKDGTKIRPKMTSKVRQCQKFVEIVNNLIQQCITTSTSTSTQQQRSISIVDMGCGRGYLTFALHSYLQKQVQQQKQQQQQHLSESATAVPPSPSPIINNVFTKGIDVRPKLVQEINAIARSLGSSYDGLTFERGTIEDFVILDDVDNNNNSDSIAQQTAELDDKSSQDDDDATSTSSSSPDDDDDDESLKILIALHACDTATDDALWYGISTLQADIIVVAPCCHKEVRSQLDQHYRQMTTRTKTTTRSGTRINSNQNDDDDDDDENNDNIENENNDIEHGNFRHPLADSWKYGIYRERMAETATDTFRATLLELAGYKVQVFEFIGGEHTSKNVMITAIKKKNGNRRSTSSESKSKGKQRHVVTFHPPFENKYQIPIYERIIDMSNFYGIRKQRLADWMKVPLMKSNHNTDNDDIDNRRRVSPSTQMPPFHYKQRP